MNGWLPGVARLQSFRFFTMGQFFCRNILDICPGKLRLLPHLAFMRVRTLIPIVAYKSSIHINSNRIPANGIWTRKRRAVCFTSLESIFFFLNAFEFKLQLKTQWKPPINASIAQAIAMAITMKSIERSEQRPTKRRNEAIHKSQMRGYTTRSSVFAYKVSQFRFCSLLLLLLCLLLLSLVVVALICILFVWTDDLTMDVEIHCVYNMLKRCSSPTTSHNRWAETSRKKTHTTIKAN